MKYIDQILGGPTSVSAADGTEPVPPVRASQRILLPLLYDAFSDDAFLAIIDRYAASIRLPDHIFQSVNGKCLQVPEASGSGMATVVGGLSSADIPQPVIGKSFPPVLALTSYYSQLST